MGTPRPHSESGIGIFAVSLVWRAKGFGAGDWRLPTTAVWEARIAHAVALGCGSPSLTNDVGTDCLSQGPTSFAGVQSIYWSSSASEGFPGSAWDASVDIDFGSGVVGKVSSFFVWPVRGGQ